MGRRGPRPQPTALKLVRGNPGKRPLPKDEPRPTLGIGPCPESLCEEAKAEWVRVVVELEKLEMLTRVDSPSLEAYCGAVVMMRQARKAITADGLVLNGKFGPVKNPAVQIHRDCAALVRQFAAEFGLTPSARTRLKAPEKKTTDPLGAFLGETG